MWGRIAILATTLALCGIGTATADSLRLQTIKKINVSHGLPKHTIAQRHHRVRAVHARKQGEVVRADRDRHYMR